MFEISLSDFNTYIPLSLFEWHMIKKKKHIVYKPGNNIFWPLGRNRSKHIIAILWAHNTVMLNIDYSSFYLFRHPLAFTWSGTSGDLMNACSEFLLLLPLLLVPSPTEIIILQFLLLYIHELYCNLTIMRFDILWCSIWILISVSKSIFFVW